LSPQFYSSYNYRPQSIGRAEPEQKVSWHEAISDAVAQAIAAVLHLA
jgi:hypothetical protein